MHLQHRAWRWDKVWSPWSDGEAVSDLGLHSLSWRIYSTAAVKCSDREATPATETRNNALFINIIYKSKIKLQHYCILFESWSLLWTQPPLCFVFLCNWNILSSSALKTSGQPAQCVKKLQNNLFFLACQLDYNTLPCLWFLTVECKVEALPYNVVNHYGYHNVYWPSGNILINLSGPQIVSPQ